MNRRGEILRNLERRIKSRVADVSLRGSGMSEFLFVQRGSRAVEISLDEGDNYWIEYWGNSPDEDAPPVKESTFRSESKVEESAFKWLFDGPVEPL